jgi:plasmid maintenance system antidote protein VapI
MAISDIEKRFAEALKKELNIRGHGSQTDVARELGIHPSTMNGYVNMQRGTTEGVRRDICRVLGLNYATFIEGSPATQTATAKHGSVVAQVAGKGNTVSVMQKSDLTAREQELITALRMYGNPEMIEAIMARLEAIRRMSVFE